MFVLTARGLSSILRVPDNEPTVHMIGGGEDASRAWGVAIFMLLPAGLCLLLPRKK